MQNSKITITADELYDAAFDQCFDVTYIDGEVNVENTAKYIEAYAENAYDSTDIEVSPLEDVVVKAMANYFVAQYKYREELDGVTYDDVISAEKEFEEISGWEV